MRQKRTVQINIFDVYVNHEIGRALKAISDCLDNNSRILDLVAEELCRLGSRNTGRIGLSAESIL